MNIVEILETRRTELEAQKAVIDKELDDVLIALDAIAAKQKGAQKTLVPKPSPPQHSMPIDEAIIIAVRNGNRTPAAVLGYLQRELHLQTTINSVRTRLSRLKRERKIVSTPFGWSLPMTMKGSLFDKIKEGEPSKEDTSPAPR